MGWTLRQGTTRGTSLALGTVRESLGVVGRAWGRDSVREFDKGSLGLFRLSWRLQQGGGGVGEGVKLDNRCLLP